MKRGMQLHNALKSRLIESISGSRLTVPLLLAFQFGIHLLIYFNTQTFVGISESGTLFGTLDRILSGEQPKPLYGFYWYFTPAYIAAFFIRIFGSIDVYFVFQCMLATLTSFLVFITVVKISGSKESGLVSIILTTVYTEYLLLSSVFYNQVYENLFVVLLLLVIVNFTGRGIKKQIIYGILVVAIALCSLMFRNTLLVVFFYFMIAGLYFLIRKRPEIGAGFLVLSLILFILVFVVKPLDFFREGDHRPPHMIEFWGHTPYGGNGGEVGFIYKENEELFNERMDEYLLENNISEATPSVVEEFKSHEVRRFITREPHKWIFLQVKKVLSTFGIMPQRDGLTMLMTGKAHVGWVPAAVLLQAPFLLIMILFLLTVDIKIKSITSLPGHKFLLYLMGLYLISAISVYATWAERYRIVAMVAFIIPVIAINIENVKKLFRRDNRKEMIIRLSFVALMILTWGCQAHEAFLIHGERYIQALELINKE